MSLDWFVTLFKNNLAEAKADIAAVRRGTCVHASKETLSSTAWRCLVCGIEGGFVPPGPTTQGYTYQENAHLTGSVNGFMPPVVAARETRDPAELDNPATTCTHPGISIHRFPDGESSYFCAVCAKTWDNLQAVIYDLPQYRPINFTEGGNVADPVGLPPALEQMASDLSFRLGQSVAELVSMTANTVSAVGGQQQTYQERTDAAQAILANKDAKDATARRQKAMEDAARAAAAAFDSGQEAEANPINLNPDRKLKVVV